MNSNQIDIDHFGELGVNNPEKLQEIYIQLFHEFSSEEEILKEFFSELHSSGGDLRAILSKKHTPVDIYEFIESDYFMGDLFDSVFPVIKEAVIDVFNGNYIEVLALGAIGVGKTSLATIINVYDLYLLSCYHNPQLSHGFMPTDDITIAMLNKNATLAKEVTYTKFRKLVLAIPYFNERFSSDPRNENKMIFPSGIQVNHGAATSDKILGMNVIGGIVDELNFMDIISNSKRARQSDGLYDQAKDIYNTLVRRKKSRFVSANMRMPGHIIPVSSANTESDFTHKRKKQALVENDGLTYIYEYSQWEALPAVKPNGGIRFSGEVFSIVVGDERHNTTILKEDEKPRKNAEVLDNVPIEFYKEFKEDPEGALRDLAGRTTASNKPYFYDRDRVYSSITRFKEQGLKSVFNSESVILYEDRIEEILDTLIKSNYKITDKFAYRSLHIDLALTGDSAGLALGYSPNTTTVTKRSGDDVNIEEEIEVIIEGILEIKPPNGGEILFYLVREIVFKLIEIGIPIKWVSYDGFQSTDSKQLLRRKGLKVNSVSMDTSIDPYRKLREGFWQERIKMSDHEKGFHEIITLQKLGNKIDHLVTGSKDVSDSICGVYENLSRKRLTQLTDGNQYVGNDNKVVSLRRGTNRRTVTRR